jgi:hypothetical protein
MDNLLYTSYTDYFFTIDVAVGKVCRVNKTIRYAGAKHKDDGNFRQSHRLSGPMYVDDGFF